jgi:hypothetical protein
MPTENLKAYHVGEGSEGEQVVTFASSSAQARREGGNELDLTFEEVSFCRRAPWADEFAGQPFIPAKAYHEQGWWLYCNNCENQLYEDAEDDDGNPLQIVYTGRHAYCDKDCKDSREKQIADANAKGEAFRTKVLSERPNLTYTEFDTGWPKITMSAKFQFPGCQYGGSVRDQEGDGKLEWFIASADQAAWDAFQQGRAA